MLKREKWGKDQNSASSLKQSGKVMVSQPFRLILWILASLQVQESSICPVHLLPRLTHLQQTRKAQRSACPGRRHVQFTGNPDVPRKDLCPQRLVKQEPSFHSGPWILSFVVPSMSARGQFYELQLIRRAER